MRISSLTINNQIPGFGSTKRTTYFDSGKGFYVLPSYDVLEIKSGEKKGIKIVDSNSTSFFRSDLDWKTLGTDIDSQFPQDKVNTYIFGCSDGSEAYSLAVTLIEQLGLENAKKYFPIHASDIDGEMAKQAKSGTVLATENDILRFIKIVKDRQLGKYFIPEKLGDKTFNLKMSKLLTDNIIFSHEDISEGLHNVKNGANLIFCRNFWKYLSPQKIAELTWEMKEKLDDSSRIVIGAYDQSSIYTPFFFENIGFLPVSKNQGFYDSNMLKFCPSKDDKFSGDKQSWCEHVMKNYSGYKLDYLY